jgi:hypothetical protein
MEACEPDPARRTRALSGEIPAAVQPGDTEIVVEVLRRGGGTTFLAARALQAGAVVARASALCAAPRPVSAARTGVTPPVLSPFGDPATRASAPPVGAGVPRFTQHYEYRPGPPAPYSNAPTAAASGWVRPRAPLAVLDGPAISGLLDAWWPASLACETRPRPMATVTFTAELLADPRTLDPVAPLAYRARLDGAADGFTVELRELWSGDTLVALNQQLFAVLA